MEERTYDLIVLGGGPAGTSAAIRAAQAGARVLLLERGRFPRHKVCGEFVSPESLRLLGSLLGDFALLESAPRIARARLWADTEAVEAELSPAAASVTRYDLDLALWRAAEQAGAECRLGIQANSVSFKAGGQFLVKVVTRDCGELLPHKPDTPWSGVPSKVLRAKSVIDASGRWSNFQPSRPLPGETWVGLKAHYYAREAVDSVDLYFFPQGYCGVQPVRDGQVNACAMVRASASVGNSLERVFAAHPELWRRSRNWTPATEVAATAPLFFRPPQPVRDGVLLAGDSAGFVDPFVGDGISMALRSGALAAQCLSHHRWQAGPAVTEYSEAYRRELTPVFRNAGRMRRLLDLPGPLRRGVLALARLPGVAEYALRSTRLKQDAPQ